MQTNPEMGDESMSAMSMDEDGAGNDSVTLPADAFATTPKEGDRMTFCVTGADEDGVRGYWMNDKDEEENESWDEGARNSVKQSQGGM